MMKLKSTTKTNFLDGVNSRVEMTEGRNSEFEDRSVGFT